MIIELKQVTNEGMLISLQRGQSMVRDADIYAYAVKIINGSIQS